METGSNIISLEKSVVRKNSHFTSNAFFDLNVCEIRLSYSTVFAGFIVPLC